MVTSRQGAAFGPTAFFAAAAGVAAFSGVAAPPAPLLLAAAVGCALGTATTALILRRDVAALSRAVAAVAGGSATTVAEPRKFGALSPVAREIDAIAETLQATQEAATTDRLTRVANRQVLLARLFEELERVARYGRPLSIAFIDLDHFKAVNDTFGHEVGDVVLRGVADVFRENTRRQDVVGRYGGEEFVIVMPETTVDEATAVA
jgi:predicted signal transduction protein with EAL and GGDEF domain